MVEPENGVSQSNPQKETRIKKSILVIILVIILVAIAGFLIWQKTGFFGFFKQKLITSIPQNLSGTILLSLRPLDNLSRSGIYTFDLSKKELKEIYAANGTSSIVSNASLQPNGKLIAFAEENYRNKISAVSVFNLETKEVKNVFSLASGAINCLSWSPDGNKLVYSFYVIGGNKTEKMSKPALGEFKILVSDLSAGQKFITNGSCPRFISNEEIVFIRDGGFWLVDSLSGAEKKIFENQSIKQDTQIAVSKDFSMVAWSTPSEKKFYLGKLSKSADAFLLSDIKIVDASVYSPFISSDNRYIIAYRPSGIIAADTDTLNAQRILDLAQFLISDGIISDWAIALPQ